LAKPHNPPTVTHVSRSGLFRSEGRGGWTALALFGVVYLAALALIFAA